jgi:beta-lactamase class A
MGRSFPFVCAAVLLFASARGEANSISDQIAAIEQRTGASIGVAAIEMATGRRAEYQSHERFPMCSTFKLLAAAVVLRRVDGGEETLDRFVPYTTRDILEYAPVTKEHLAEGGMRLGALCEAAIEQSDNTAGNLLLQAIGGPAGLTKFARSLDDPITRLDRIEPDLNGFTPGDDRDTTTASAMCGNLVRLFTTDVLSRDSRAQLESWLKKTETGARFIRAAVPNGWQVGDKTGRSRDGATNDVAVLYPPNGSPIFIAIYSIGKQTSEDNRSAAVADTAREVIKTLRSDATNTAAARARGDSNTRPTD